MPRSPANRRWVIWAALFVSTLVIGVCWWNSALSSPNKTLQAFCDALNQGDRASMVALYTPRLRSFEEHSRPPADSIISCTPRHRDSRASDIRDCHVITARLASQKEVVLLVWFEQDANHNWLIDGITYPQPHDTCLQ